LSYPVRIDSFRGDYAFLSNFYPVDITWEGLPYNSVEHAFQSAKSLDPSVRKRFISGTCRYCYRLPDTHERGRFSDSLFCIAKDGFAKRIYSPVKPGDAKRMGRRLKLRPDWEEVKLAIMLDLLRLKFRPIILKPRSLGPTLSTFQTSLAGRLIATGEAELIESNTWNDFFWGVCMGVGENHLGKLLMRVRKELTE
jgi:N-glycosidase YbiA